MDQLAQVLEHIEKRRDFVLTSHARPDGDAIGSSLALGEILGRMGKTVSVVLSDQVPVIYKPLPFAERIVHASEVNGRHEAAIILECDSVQRTRLNGLEKHFLINIDHHLSSKPFANVNWIDPRACAAAEMVFRLANAAGVDITPEIATCLYTAVLTDTGSFSYSATTAHTFDLARILVDKGADPARIAQHVYFSNPLSKMKLLGIALTSLQTQGPVGWMTISRSDMESCHGQDEDCEGLVNYALSVSSIEVAILFRETSEHRIRVSIRSKGAVNVAEIAGLFGGGGHERASGFSVDGPFAAAEKKVLAELMKRLSHHG